MNSILMKILGGVLSVFTIIYFGYQVYMMTYDPYPTETALVTTYTDQIEIDGIAVKSEQVLTDSISDGIIRYNNGSSKKVVSDSVVATIYASEEDLLIGNELENKQNKLALMQELQDRTDSIQVNAQSVVSNIKSSQIDFVNAIETNDYSSIADIEDNLFSLLLRQQIVLNSNISFSDAISTLENEISSLQNQISRQGQEITVPASGYFTNQVDGYESLITPAFLEDMSDFSVNELHTLLTKSVQANASTIGKLIDSTEWYFLGMFESSDVDRLSEGTTVTLQFPNSVGYSVKATINQVICHEDEAQGIVLLESNNMNDAIVDLRVERPSVVFSSSKGIRVSKQAMRIIQQEETANDGSTKLVSVPGVYITIGQMVKFKQIDVLYEDSDYIISRLHEDESNYLHIYDEVILEGDDLYDGKPIR